MVIYSLLTTYVLPLNVAHPQIKERESNSIVVIAV